jgi:hypothetical protein
MQFEGNVNTNRLVRAFFVSVFLCAALVCTFILFIYFEVLCVASDCFSGPCRMWSNIPSAGIKKLRPIDFFEMGVATPVFVFLIIVCGISIFKI